MTSERKVNDVGGLDGGSIDRNEHPQTLFEQRVDALVMLLIHPEIGAFKVDALRRMLEQNSPEDYATLGYYQKWVRAVRDLLIEQEVLTPEEIRVKLAEVRARYAEGGRER
ncbi:MAG: nitrile hydratase subunit beta [Ectothiorhodospiraceae bacterium]|nr:nitrile hydratase subunit beta [Ectothiorhodospiraceae bacterium]